MTINVAALTYDAIVLGCDSFSSLTDTAIFPFRPDGAGFALDENGDFITDRDGNFVVALAQPHIETVATTVFGGVNKMFLLFEDGDTSVAATTAGMGTLNGLTIAAHAGRYRRACGRANTHFDSVSAVAEDFRAYIRSEWERQTDWENLPDERKRYLGTVELIVGGFSPDHDHGQVFVIDTKENSCHEQFEEERSGLCWTGQANFVERLLSGVDGRLRAIVSREIVRALEDQRTTLLEGVSRELHVAGIAVPDGTELRIEETVEPSLPWSVGWADIDYANLPTQYGIDLVSFLVNTQSGMQHFSKGIATVGGRTHIGVLRRGERFTMLHEPELTHDHTGFSHDR
ncbi:hypothetical protein J2T07_001613 [Luteibacter jiangsuensis]|uniref:Uncharacterized protein n=1 Tax=Luteibacter jiangsuensis TaxID=637577 RepID=A0ABT9SWS3_9GAMM|nr:hypothetical protein [Luteibacter jiangsuensis]MDQ0009436.1 hypothetical protein [Luteibacter jiangsuensis]